MPAGGVVAKAMTARGEAVKGRPKDSAPGSPLTCAAATTGLGAQLGARLLPTHHVTSQLTCATA